MYNYLEVWTQHDMFLIDCYNNMKIEFSLYYWLLEWEQQNSESLSAENTLSWCQLVHEKNGYNHTTTLFSQIS